MHMKLPTAFLRLPLTALVFVCASSVLAQSDHLVPADPAPFQSVRQRNRLNNIARALESQPHLQIHSVVQIIYYGTWPGPEASCLSLCGRGEDGLYDEKSLTFTLELLSIANAEELEKSPEVKMEQTVTTVDLDRELGLRIWKVWQTAVMNTRHAALNFDGVLLDGGGAVYHSVSYKDGQDRCGLAPATDKPGVVNMMGKIRDLLQQYIQTGGKDLKTLEKVKSILAQLESELQAKK
jgi:hypothetical protein